MKQNFLCIETGSKRGSLALYTVSQSNIEHMTDLWWEKQSSHSEVITDKLQQILSEHPLSMKDLDFLVLGVGPGSFTGIRVGLNFAKSLAYSLQIPIFSFSSLQVLACEAHKSRLPILVMMKAFKNLIYTATYFPDNERLSEVHAPSAQTPQEIEANFCGKPHVVLGDAFDTFKDFFSPGFKSSITRSPTHPFFPQAKTLGELFLIEQTSAQPKSWQEIKPLYIRGSEAEEKLRSGVLRPVPKI